MSTLGVAVVAPTQKILGRQAVYPDPQPGRWNQDTQVEARRAQDFATALPTLPADPVSPK
jgi:hypothetical protein